MNVIIIAMGLISSWLLLWRLSVLEPAVMNNRRRVSVIIPARNEANNIKKLLDSLKGQASQPYEIIVADDQSSDGTAHIAEMKGASVIKPLPLPEGWHGKSWACSEGAKAATGDILIFLDADVAVQQKGIEKLTAAFEDRCLDVLTLQPYHETKHFYEQFSAFFQLISIASIGEFVIGRPEFS